MRNGDALGMQAPDINIASVISSIQYSILLTYEAAVTARPFTSKGIHAGCVSHFQYRGNRG
jgi:hypothetical protein